MSLFLFFFAMQLSVFSAFDIYFRLLRSGLPPPSFFGNGLEDLLPGEFGEIRANWS